MTAITVADLDNAQIDVTHLADIAMSPQYTATDRRGNTKKTVAGLFAGISADAAARLAALGYMPPVVYAAGLRMNTSNQTVTYNGVTYAPIADKLPFTTGAAFDASQWRVIQGVTVLDLAAPGAAAMVGFAQMDLNAGATTVAAKLRNHVDDVDFYLAGTTPVSMWQRAVDAVSSRGGGTVHQTISADIDADLYVQSNVTVKGPHTLVGSPMDNNTAPYGTMIAFRVNSQNRIVLRGGAGLAGCLIYRKGMVFPAADSSAFAGNAIEGGGDDAFVINSMVLGFGKFYYSNGYQRPRIYNVWHDNTNGIEIVNCADVAHVHDNHAWPFATIASGGNHATLERSGNAYHFHDLGDWGKSTNNFSYAYQRGHLIVNCNSMTLLSPSHDGTQLLDNSIGIEILGDCEDTRICLPQTAAQNIGIHINTSAICHTSIIGGNQWANRDHSILIDGGDVTIMTSARNSPQGVTINNVASRVSVLSSRFRDINPYGSPISNKANSPYLVLENNDYGNWAAGVSPVKGAVSSTLPSADPLSLPASGRKFIVSGDGGFGSISGGFEGREVTLLFTGLAPVYDGGASLKLAGNFTGGPGRVLRLEFINGAWNEASRSAN